MLALVRQLLFVFIFFLMASPRATAGETISQVTRYDLDNGLPSNNVYCVLQDRLGYIWILTDNGIVKYNGYTFKVFNTSNGLPSNDIWYLSEDKYGRMWVYMHSEEIGYIKNDVYHKVNISAEKGLIRMGQMLEKNGFVYLVLAGKIANKFYIVDSNDHVTTSSLSESYEVLSLQTNTFAQQYDHQRFVGSFHWNAGNVKRRFSCISSHGVLLENVFTPMKSGYRCIYHNTGSREVVFTDTRNCRYRRVPLTELGAGEAERVYIVYPYKDCLAIVTTDRVYIIDEQFNCVGIKDFSSFVSSQVSYYHQANDRNEWVATKNGCYNKYSIPSCFVADSNLLLKGSMCVATLKDGVNWWFDENKRLLYKVSPIGHIISTKPFNDKLTRVMELDSQKLALLSLRGLWVLDLHNEAVTRLIDIQKPFYVNNLLSTDYSVLLKRRADTVKELKEVTKLEILNAYKSIHQYQPGQYYGINHNGLYRLQQFESYNFYEMVSSGKYTDLIYDSTYKCYWAYNSTNFLHFDPVSNTGTVFDKKMLEKFGLSTLTSVCTDRYGNIYFQHSERLTIVNPGIGTYRQVQVPLNIADAKLKVDNEYVYIAGGFGIARATIRGPLAVSDFDIVLNTNSISFNRVYNVLLGTNHVRLITDKGIFKLNETIFSTKAIKSAHAFQRLVLTYPYEEKVDRMDTLMIPPGLSRVNFDLINFYGRGQVSYKYTIRSDMGTSVSETQSGELFLDKLDIDKVYRVECTVQDEFWMNDDIVFYVCRVPYWWQTNKWEKIFWVSGILLLLCIVISVVVITRYFVARTNKKKKLLLELELRAVYSQINPHFIFNTLSSSLNAISKKDFNEAYANISTFARLLRAYLKSSRSRYVTVADEIGMLRDYVDLQKKRFGEKLEYEIVVENKVPADSILIPSLLLQPLIENAINHGLFHKEDKGFLSIRFFQGRSSNELICEIEDNGVGRRRSKEIYEQSALKKESYGTPLTEELIGLYKKYESMNISVAIIDKSGAETGTIVRLTISDLKHVEF